MVHRGFWRAQLLDWLRDWLYWCHCYEMGVCETLAPTFPLWIGRCHAVGRLLPAVRHGGLVGRSQRAGLVVGNVEAHPLVHLRVAGGTETICDRSTTHDWPTKTFRTAACLGCLESAIVRGYHFALDSDGIPVTLKRLIAVLAESSLIQAVGHPEPSGMEQPPSGHPSP